MPEFHPLTERILRLDLSWKIVGPVGFPIAVWLVRDRDRWVLIDAGGRPRANELVDAAGAATDGAGPAEILLTLGHSDHISGLSAVLEAWHVPVSCHPKEVESVRGPKTYADQPSTSILFSLFRRILPTTSLPSAGLRILSEGSDAAGMEVIHLPGHTPGQIRFLHAEDRAFICGDAVMSLGGRLSGPLPMATPDPAAARRSMGFMPTSNTTTCFQRMESP